MKLFMVAGAFVLAGCGSWSATPRASTSGSSGPDLGPGIPISAPRPTAPAPSKTPSRAPGLANRTLCKNVGVPRGFVTVDYTRSTDCPGISDSTSFNARVVTDLSSYPIGTALIICRDQVIPAAWSISNPEPDTAQCVASERLASDGKPAIEITRKR